MKMKTFTTQRDFHIKQGQHAICFGYHYTKNSAKNNKCLQWLSLEHMLTPRCLLGFVSIRWSIRLMLQQHIIWCLVAFSFKEFLFSLFSLPFGPCFPCYCSYRKMRKHDSEHFPCFPAPAEAQFRSQRCPGACANFATSVLLASKTCAHWQHQSYIQPHSLSLRRNELPPTVPKLHQLQ